ncbi:MAG: ComF family protein [Raineya sp.]|jgi:ComF family protein|nr:ComF family protein [Raineya sp.]
MKKLIQDFISLIFPDSCYSCQGVLLQGEYKVCTACRGNLPFTNYHKLNPSDNPITQKFFGKVPILYGLSFLQFAKDGKVQRLLHHIKYKNEPELAEILGNWYGAELFEKSFHQKFDMILSVPLHPKKLKIRGYNQSDYFGRGLSKQLQIPFYDNILLRNVHSSTQTKKTRYERWQNVHTIFNVSDSVDIKDKSILLVDDVITTGATLEACAKVLLELDVKFISIATIAVA